MSVPNLEKLFQYLQCFALEPIRFGGKIDDKEVTHPITIGDKITEIKLNKTFFDNDSCQMCGGCDPSESCLYTQSEYEAILNCSEVEFIEAGLDPKYLIRLQSGLIQEQYEINGDLVSVYIYKQEFNQLYLPTRGKVIDRCTWCFQDSEKRFKCRIHPVESITCIMPHLRTYHVKGTSKASIGIHQFGRNWALKCPVILTPPSNESEFEHNKRNRIEKLQRLYQVGLDLNIETYIPEVIKYIENIEYTNYEMYLETNVLAKRTTKLF